MKKLLLSMLLVLATGMLYSQVWLENLPQEKVQSGELSFFEIQKAFNDYWEPLNVEKGYYEVNGEMVKAAGWKQFKRWEWYWENRVDPNTGEFPTTSAFQELNDYLANNPVDRSASGNWTSMGPSTTGGGYAGLGRLNSVAFRPGDNNTLYVGAPSGGIWKSTDGGSNWTPQGDNNAIIGVSDIVVIAGATTASDIVYIATGDRDAGDNYSIGVLKSTDGGTTWVATGLSFQASQGHKANRLLLDPANNNILYAATTAGVYKTTDAGANWVLQTGTSFIDMEMKPGSSTILYGSTTTGRIYRSTDSGANWTEELYDASGRRTELAVTANNSAVVYAVMGNSGNGFHNIYKSTDSGASFSSTYSGPTNILNWDCSSTASGGQAWYDLCIAADPTNADVIFVGGVNTWKSTNGGSSWSISNHWSGTCSGSATNIHADKHFMAYQNGTSTLFECNDGGLYKTANGGSSWNHLTNGMEISQIYKIGVAQTVNNDVIAGLQDNGTKAMISGNWNDVIGGDGMDCAIDPSDHNTQYGELYYGDIKRTTNHWGSYSTITSGLSGSAAWVAPFVIDPSNTNTVYIGYQDVFKSTNQGSSWSKISSWSGSTLRSLAVAPSNSNTICAATTSTLYRTTNGGSNWTNITGSFGGSTITSIAIKEDDPNTIWVSLGQFNSNSVYQSADGGSSWTNISTGLPQIPTLSVIQNKQNAADVELYAGTDVGVYMKLGAADWVPFFTGLPNVVVNEVEIYYAADPVDSRIRAGTYGRGLWESDLNTTQLGLAANFTADNLNPLLNTTVVFTDASSGDPISWDWSFTPTSVVYVDGTNANSQHPKVQFTTETNYTVSLTVSDGLTQNTKERVDYIAATSTCSYCSMTYSNTSDDYISKVVFNTIDNPSASSTFSDFTSVSTDVEQNSTYTLSVDVTVNGSWAQHVWAWFDWNGDCDLDDAGEAFDLGVTPGTAGTHTLTLDIPIPADANLGTTRMRVAEHYDTDPLPCQSSQYGEGEDYTVNVIEGGSVTPPSCTTVNAPLDAATSISISTNLDWNAAATATGYKLYFGTDNPPTSMNNGTNLGNVTLFDPASDLAYNTTYYWKVVPYNSGGDATGCSVWSFTTEDQPVGGIDELSYTDFENGWSIWTDGGDDCVLYTKTKNAPQGSNAGNIQDNSGVASSFYLTSGVDVHTPGYIQIDVEFTYKAVGMETNEDFWVQYYDGSSWNTVGTYVSGSDFNNDQVYSTKVSILESQYTFPADMKIRFMCDASDNRDDVFIDQIRILASTQAIPGVLQGVRPENNGQLTGEMAEVKIYPNPSEGYFYVNGQDLAGAELYLFDLQGRMVLNQKLTDDHTTIITNTIKAGVYMVRVVNQNEIISHRIVVK